MTAALGSLAVLLILWRMLAGSPTLKIGIFLGLAAAVAITVGALMALAEDGFRPLVAVAAAPAKKAKSSQSTASRKSSPKKASSKKTTSKKSSSAKSGSSGSKRSSGSRKK